MNDISRRQWLAGAAIATASATLPPFHTAQGGAPQIGLQEPGYYRFKVGDFEVTAVNDGTWFRKLGSFMRSADIPNAQQALTDAFLPSDVMPIPFTMLMVNTGPRLIAFDVGTGGQFGSLAPQSGTFLHNLNAADIDPDDVDAIYISHFHPDHINGIKTKDNELVFPNASINVPEAEWAFWMDDSNIGKVSDAIEPTFKNARRIFGDIAKTVQRFQSGKEVESGITSIAAPGHTPGHTAFSIASGNQSLLYFADVAFAPAVFVRHPEWQPVVDMDGNGAVATRKAMLDRAATDKVRVHGYHWPFPGSGYVTRMANGYDLVPVMWQPTL